MVDDLEEQSSGRPRLQHYLGVVRRRHLHFLIPLFLGWAVVWGASWVLPPRYQSSTLILVEQPTMPKDYVTPNVNDDLQERMQSITQQILSRTRLLHIIDAVQPICRRPRSSVRPTRRSIACAKTSASSWCATSTIRSRRSTSTYTSRDPHSRPGSHQRTDQSVHQREPRRAAAAVGRHHPVSRGQLETARKTLSDQEDRIREFKAQHVGEMPGQLASNLQILSGLQSQLQNEEDALNTARQQHVYLQTLADQYRTMQGCTERRGRHDQRRIARSRPGTGQTQSATGRPQLALHRSPSRCSQAERTDREDREDARPAARQPEDEGLG